MDTEDRVSNLEQGEVRVREYLPNGIGKHNMWNKMISGIACIAYSIKSKLQEIAV